MPQKRRGLPLFDPVAIELLCLISEYALCLNDTGSVEIVNPLGAVDEHGENINKSPDERSDRALFRCLKTKVSGVLTKSGVLDASLYHNYG
jgi:hypothetical protein